MTSGREQLEYDAIVLFLSTPLSRFLFPLGSWHRSPSLILIPRSSTVLFRAFLTLRPPSERHLSHIEPFFPAMEPLLFV